MADRVSIDIEGYRPYLEKISKEEERPLTHTVRALMREALSARGFEFIPIRQLKITDARTEMKHSPVTMSGVYHLDITESEQELKVLLRSQTTASDKERVQLLYLLKSGQAETMQQAAALLGRHRVTIHKWAKRYSQGGLEQLLYHAPRPGRKSNLPAWAETELRKRLEQPEGFESYEAIQQWLATELGIVAPYKTVHQWVHYRLGASPKVVRPQSEQQNEAELAAYKKTA